MKYDCCILMLEIDTLTILFDMLRNDNDHRAILYFQGSKAARRVQAN